MAASQAISFYDLNQQLLKDKAEDPWYFGISEYATASQWWKQYWSPDKNTLNPRYVPYPQNITDVMMGDQKSMTFWNRVGNGYDTTDGVHSYRDWPNYEGAEPPVPTPPITQRNYSLNMNGGQSAGGTPPGKYWPGTTIALPTQAWWPDTPGQTFTYSLDLGGGQSSGGTEPGEYQEGMSITLPTEAWRD